jgi:paired small multidrug resistance pump
LEIGLAHAYNFWTWIATIILIIWSNYLMIRVAQVLPAGTVYVVFVGLGAGGTVFADIIFFGEPFRLAKVCLIVTLLSGVIGLKLITNTEDDEIIGRS